MLHPPQGGPHSCLSIHSSFNRNTKLTRLISSFAFFQHHRDLGSPLRANRVLATAPPAQSVPAPCRLGHFTGPRAIHPSRGRATQGLAPFNPSPPVFPSPSPYVHQLLARLGEAPPPRWCRGAIAGPPPATMASGMSEAMRTTFAEARAYLDAQEAGSVEGLALVGDGERGREEWWVREGALCCWGCPLGLPPPPRRPLLPGPCAPGQAEGWLAACSIIRAWVGGLLRVGPLAPCAIVATSATEDLAGEAY